METTAWRDISTKDDDVAEAMIREDKIDILVDLSGHTGGNRLPLFTRKPAPIQAHAWGFAHGTGCPEIDWFLADEYAIPQAERQFFAEQIWDLPAIVGYEPSDYGQPATSPPPVTRDGTFTFGVFGRFEKYSPQSLEAWHKILLRTPGSVLQFKDATMRRPYAIRRILDAMKGIDPKRLRFMQDTSHTEQMLAYQGVDLVLDTFPHTGGVTALEMLYMGVPVVTLYNGQVGGRTTSVVLRQMGRQSWIAESIDEYVKIAAEAARERTRVAQARGSLRKELLDSPICGSRYVRAVETAYRSMWWRYCGHVAAVSRDTDAA
jgi:predicted O-linked N-acetylglucosamine transferase (SPINDLY family)